MKKSDKPSLRSLLDSQLDLERDARKSVAWGIKQGLISRANRTDQLRMVVENARRRGWIK